MTSRRVRLRLLVGVVALLCAVAPLSVAAAGPRPQRLPDTHAPALTVRRVVSTTPFLGSGFSALDNEGSAYVRKDDTIWIADDNGQHLLEVEAGTGRLVHVVQGDALERTRPRGGGSRAGHDRVGDLESIAYDRRRDRLFAFSGSCCTPEDRPTAFRLARNARGNLRPQSYQALPEGSDFTAAGWNAADGTLYLADHETIRSFRYARNTLGEAVTIPGVANILGMTFTRDGADLLVTQRPAVLSRISWPTLTLVPGWTFDLGQFGVMDARGVELRRGQIWVSDGFDFRPGGDPMTHAFAVLEPSTS